MSDDIRIGQLRLVRGLAFAGVVYLVLDVCGNDVDVLVVASRYHTSHVFCRGRHTWSYKISADDTAISG